MLATLVAITLTLATAHAETETESITTLDNRGTGVGLGLTFTPLFDDQTLNPPALDRFSVRIQLSEHFALEPTALLHFDRVGNDPDEHSQTLQTGGALGARWYATSLGPVHLVGLAGVGGSRSSSLNVADGEPLSAVQTHVFTRAGLGVEWTPSERLAVGLDMQNPVFQLSRAVADVPDGETSETVAWGAGLAFDPQVSLMTHVYFGGARRR